ncbi:MAG: hypothetical protein CM1200mP9_05940 [Gammaproteobacteria bacterium]|nr:MAG: hypothetical protein CM1200mP9_05940 [Gammaproteobacteria bacterium]
MGPLFNSTLRQLVRDWIDAGAQNITTDTDGDGLEDDSDNCASVAKADQLDTDSDGLGNAWTTTMMGMVSPIPGCVFVGFRGNHPHRWRRYRQ